ncbi:MAG: hypothetical protein LQ340_007496, partial [Diploschistes diacapsis]
MNIIRLLPCLLSLLALSTPIFSKREPFLRSPNVNHPGPILDQNLTIPVHDALIPKIWPNPNLIPGNYSLNRTDLIPGFTYIPLEYPWRSSHDSRPGRKNHQYWLTTAAHAYCVHLNPAHREPATPFPSFIGSRCTRSLRSDFGLSALVHTDCHVNEIDSGVDPSDATEGYRLHMMLYRWDKPEHCRAGCETCFDAMEEYGAEGAWCARSWNLATCQMALLKRDEYRAWWTPYDVKGRFIYYGDDIQRATKMPEPIMEPERLFDKGQSFILPN